MERQSSIDLLSLPPEIVFQIIMSLSVDEILQKCRTSVFFNDICNNEFFWKEYARKHKIPLKSISSKASVRETAFIKKKITSRYERSFVENGIPNEIHYRIDGDSLSIKFTLTENIPRIFTPAIISGYDPIEKRLRCNRHMFVDENGNVTISMTFYYSLEHGEFDRKYNSINDFVKKNKNVLIDDALQIFVSRMVELKSKSKKRSLL